MKLYYTTSAGTGALQADPRLSLGGFMASNTVLNDDFGNLFGEITPTTINKNRAEYIAIMMQNETTDDLENVELWFVHPEDSYSKMTVAGVIPAMNADGEYEMERIPNKYSKPYTGDFEEATVDTKYVIGDMEAGTVIGLWIKRELLLDIIVADQADIYTPDPNQPRHYLPVEKEKEDSIPLNISWDIVVAP